MPQKGNCIANQAIHCKINDVEQVVSENKNRGDIQRAYCHRFETYDTCVETL